MTQTVKRDARLRDLLQVRRREMQGDVKRGARQSRAGLFGDVGDALDQSDAGVQRDIDLALLQKRVQTLALIDQAIVRLDAGTYGVCVDCEDDIAELRLRAVPLASRCQVCEGQREQEQSRVSRRAGTPLALDSESMGS